MGSILLFPSREDTARRRPRTAPESAGRILLFTGVRYERWVEPEPGTSQPASAQTAARRRAPRSHRRA